MATNPIELLFGPNLKGPLLAPTASGTQQFAGRTLISAGSVSVTVSTRMVNSDSIILFGTETGSMSVTSAGPIAVNSKVSGVSFALCSQNSISCPYDRTVGWMIVKAS